MHGGNQKCAQNFYNEIEEKRLHIDLISVRLSVLYVAFAVESFP
jgi:hypothetical protein